MKYHWIDRELDLKGKLLIYTKTEERKALWKFMYYAVMGFAQWSIHIHWLSEIYEKNGKSYKMVLEDVYQTEEEKEYTYISGYSARAVIHGDWLSGPLPSVFWSYDTIPTLYPQKLVNSGSSYSVSILRAAHLDGSFANNIIMHDEVSMTLPTLYSKIYYFFIATSSSKLNTITLK